MYLVANQKKIVELVFRNKLKVHYSKEIMEEYELVFFRPKFDFDRNTVNRWLNCIIENGHVSAPTPSTFATSDESDRIFYDVAKECNTYLITGNAKHYPDEPFILSPAQFLTSFEREN